MGVVVTDAEVTLTDVLTLRIAADEPIAEGTRLILRQRGTGEERDVVLGTPGGRVLGALGEAGVAVSLAPLGLAPGRWDAYLESGGSRVRIQSVDPGFSLDGLDAYALGRRELAYRAYRTMSGFLAIKIEEAEPVADVRAVWFREGRFEVTGLLAYTGLDDDDRNRTARLALRHNDPDATVTVAATVQGVRFHAALSLCDVLAATPESEGVWEPSLEVDGVDGELPLGARLDDVEGKRRRVHYPQAVVDGVPITPSFTSDDELRLEVGT
ncbi:hypothetical protein Pth03_08820 [Planotetraspora thailandica]|uniref:Uncharacterized protein n=1 Tax=Planotetraspora thailandica TaxID=487172 RepID=A0A8J3UWE7_9ACTN|nr:hypothetical protein [Planotetraspora thailandica]GII52493.1 hypothetical protein Pth03_08820 [Planotetraspora thailandica]